LLWKNTAQAAAAAAVLAARVRWCVVAVQVAAAAHSRAGNMTPAIWAQLKMFP
jgi:hypothetical protein